MKELIRAHALRLSQPGSINWINAVVLVVLIAFSITFATANEDEVRLAFLGLVSHAMPLYVPIFLAFLTGFLGGVIALSFSRRKHKREISLLSMENERLSKEVENLRNIPLQDDV